MLHAQDLGGTWELRGDPVGSLPGQVPGCVHADLRNDGPLAEEAHKFVWANHRNAFIDHTDPDGFPSTLKEFLSDPANQAIRYQVLNHIKATSAEVREDLLAFQGDRVHLFGRQWWSGSLADGKVHLAAAQLPWNYISAYVAGSPGARADQHDLRAARSASCD